jgi:hypothetical protein
MGNLMNGHGFTLMNRIVGCHLPWCNAVHDRLAAIVTLGFVRYFEGLTALTRWSIVPSPALLHEGRK